MKITDNCLELGREIRLEQGFEAYVLGNDRVEITVLPELGSKIISLKNLRTGREWMWHPTGGPALFPNDPGDDFSTSPLVGMDECLPTIAPCAWQKRTLPDHGEVWSKSWNVDGQAWVRGVLSTSVRLEVSPFDFQRSLELREDVVHLNYKLNNRGANEEQFVWAMHPLLRLRTGDELLLPASTRALLKREAWTGALDSGVPPGRCAKVFAGPLTEGFAGIHNPKTGDRLELEWSPAENDTLGVWLSRGGWHGHEHFALEPTNAADDRLDQAAARKHCGRLAAAGTASWTVRVRLAP